MTEGGAPESNTPSAGGEPPPAPSPTGAEPLDAMPPPTLPPLASPPPGAPPAPPPGPMQAYGQPLYAPGPSPEPPWDGFAVVAFILAVLGTTCLSAALGIAGLVRTQNGQRRGRGLAIAAIVISILWAVIFIGLVALTLSNTAQRDSSGNVTEAGTESFENARVGDCLTDLSALSTTESTTVRSLNVAPCGQPHQGQIVVIFDMPGGPYPGQDTVFEDASTQCSQRVPSETASAGVAQSLDFALIYPLADSWQRGDRQVICVMGKTGGTMTESLPGL